MNFPEDMPKELKKLLTALTQQFPDIVVKVNELNEEKQAESKTKDVIIDNWYNATKEQMISEPPFNKDIKVKMSSESNWVTGYIIGKTMEGVYLMQSADTSDKTIYKVYSDRAIFKPVMVELNKKSPIEELADTFTNDMDHVFDLFSEDTFESEAEFKEALALKMLDLGWTKK